MQHTVYGSLNILLQSVVCNANRTASSGSLPAFVGAAADLHSVGQHQHLGSGRGSPMPRVWQLLQMGLLRPMEHAERGKRRQAHTQLEVGTCHQNVGPSWLAVLS